MIVNTHLTVYCGNTTLRIAVKRKPWHEMHVNSALGYSIRSQVCARYRNAKPWCGACCSVCTPHHGVGLGQPGSHLRTRHEAELRIYAESKGDSDLSPELGGCPKIWRCSLAYDQIGFSPRKAIGRSDQGDGDEEDSEFMCLLELGSTSKWDRI